MSQRVDYDKIAECYDTECYRGKEVDPDLIKFLERRSDRAEDNLAVLDIGCGTGSQLFADRAHGSYFRMVGLDLSLGMLNQAKNKDTGIPWVQADAARLPLKKGSFDFVTSQFSFHHIREKERMILEIFRVLRPEGRFVMTNLCPVEMADWAIYRYFPAAWQKDLQDFPTNEEIKGLMTEAGFKDVEIELRHRQYEDDLQDFAKAVRLRVTSQFVAISDADYQAGLWQIEKDLNQAESRTASIPSEYCLVKITADKAA